MNDHTVEPMGGDLFHLWTVANVNLVEAENTYIEMTEIHQNVLAGVSEETHGICWSAWRDLQEALHGMLYLTGSSLEMSSKALNMVIDEFKYVDEDNGKKLTKAGVELNKDINDPHIGKDIEVERDGELVAPEQSENTTGT